jgi:(S)-2-hydroxyglutarate dehydrogenase
VHSPAPPADPPARDRAEPRPDHAAPRGAAETFDFAVIGGGVVGLATAMALAEAPGVGVALLEAEDRVAAHQSSHNSGVIHSGLYYAPGSLKARLCVAGREAMFGFCAQHGVPHERCGKLVIAADEGELPRLDEIERRGRANGLAGIRRLGPAGIREHEPHAGGVAALLVPETGITDFAAVAAAMAERLRAAGGELRTGVRVARALRDGSALVLDTTQGPVRARFLVSCAGLHADRVARACGVEPGVTIVPFRGEYWEIVAERRNLVRHLIYPVPDPRFPFLGVHFTRLVRGGIEAGPNAVLALAREGYARSSFSARDTLELLRTPGFWRMGLRHWRTGVRESGRARSAEALARGLARLVPGIRAADLSYRGSGVRAMAVGRDGRLLDDFHIVEAERQIHVLNAPSPAATASIAIGREIAARALVRRVRG